MAGSVDPQLEVAAPIRVALNGIVVRGAATFGAVTLAVWATISMTDGPLHAVAHLALPILLVAVILWRVVHVTLRRPPVDTEGAWARVRAYDSGETLFASLVAAMLPVAWLVGGIAIAVRHVDHHNLGAMLGIALPLGAALWFLATLAWIHDCRERLARALDDSERRFRDYWANVRTSA